MVSVQPFLLPVNTVKPLKFTFFFLLSLCPLTDMSIEELVRSLKEKIITSSDVAKMVEDGKITKAERRKITKLSKKVITPR